TAAPDTAARTQAGTVPRGSGGTPVGHVVGEGTVQHRKPGRAAEVQRVDRRDIVKDSTAEAVAASLPSSADGLVVGQRTARDGDCTPQHVRHTAAQGIAAVVAGASGTAYGLVGQDPAVAERDCGSQNIDESGAKANASEWAGGVAGAAD